MSSRLPLLASAIVLSCVACRPAVADKPKTTPSEVVADAVTLPVGPVNVARDVPETLSVDPSQLTRPTRLYTVCALGGMAEHGFIKDGRVYAPGGGGVACWDLETGNVIRRYPQIGRPTMPLLEHGLLVGVGRGGLRAVSADDGKTESVTWRQRKGTL